MCSGRKEHATAITQLPADYLRGGTVKARRPRVCAGGAKRSALHGAEHRCTIIAVMTVGAKVTASAINVHAACRARMRLGLAEGFPGKNWAANTLQCGSRAEQAFPGNSGPDRPEKCGPDPRAYDAQTQGASRRHTCRREPGNDSGSHGVSDPSGQARGHVGRAQRGRSRHGLHPPR